MVRNETLEKFSKEIIIIKSLYLVICIILGLIGNLVVLITILKYRKLQTITNYFVLNLSITDLLFIICCMPTIIITTIAEKWLLGDVVCNIIGFLNVLLCTNSIWNLVMISINRYLNVAKPKRIKEIYTRKKTILMIISVWIVSGIVSVPPLLNWSSYKPGPNFCTVDRKGAKSFYFLILFIMYILPLLILASLYSCIFFILKKKEKNILLKCNINYIEHSDCKGKASIHKNDLLPCQAGNKRISHKKIMINYFINKNNDTYKVSVKKAQNHNKKLQKRVKLYKQYQITRRLIVLVLSFFLCWTPFFIGSFLITFGVENKKNFSFTTFGVMCGCLSSISNPFIYSMNGSFRNHLRKLSRKYFNKKYN
ncbi:alpha-1A adrenergic receptor [Hydra vulgaris]|uniref:Alpha-1A adrenergic receptor n=1 Tax=Hydra vulgaris TaxID=6087 RepID=A0ABM4BBX2_HYDVU